MLDTMISYLWPEGMMQYTVIGAEAASADPKDRPDLVFKTIDGYITGRHSFGFRMAGLLQGIR